MSQIPAIKVLSSFGLRGYTKIFPYISIENLQKVKSLFNENGVKYEIEDLNAKGKVAKIKFKGIDTPEEVSMLTNQELLIDSALLPKLDDNEVYFFELIDRDVIYKAKLFGKVYAVQNFGAGDVIEIAPISEDGELADTVFVPFTKDCIRVTVDNVITMTDFAFENYFKK